MSDAGVEYIVEHVKVRVRAAPCAEAEIVDVLCLGDVVAPVEILELKGETWARLAQGIELRSVKHSGTLPKVHMKLAQEGYAPISHPMLGRPLKLRSCAPTEEACKERPRPAAIQPRLPVHPRIPQCREIGVDEVPAAVARAAQWIASADAVVVGSGAGMGADSTGERLAGNWPGLEDLQIPYEEMCHSKWFSQDPRLAWGFWQYSTRAYQSAKPHHGYSLVQEWARRAALGTFSITSNIDRHWEASNWDQDRIVEFHGAVDWLQCSQPCCPAVWAAEVATEQGDSGRPAVAADEEDGAALHRFQGEMPRCRNCGAVARPAVQMFGGDAAFSKERRSTQLARYDSWLKQMAARPDYDKLSVVCLELGCGPAAPAVRKELEAVMRRFPAAKFVRMNTEQVGFMSKDLRERGVSLPLKVCEGLEKIQEQLSTPAEQATFVLWDQDGDGVEVSAPLTSTMEQLLRLARRVPSVELIIRTGVSARVVNAVSPGEDDVEVPMSGTVPVQMLYDVQEGAKAAAVVFQGVQITSGTSPVVEQRISLALESLDDLNRLMGSGEPDAKVQALRAQVGLVLCGSKEVEEKANSLANLMYFGQQVPRTPSTPTEPRKEAKATLSPLSLPSPTAVLTATAVAASAAAVAAAGASTAVELPAGAFMEVILVRLATEGSGNRQRLPMSVPMGTTIGELRALLCKEQGFDEDTGKKVRFQMSKGDGRFKRLGEDELAVPEIFMASVPALRLRSEEKTAPAKMPEAHPVPHVPLATVAVPPVPVAVPPPAAVATPTAAATPAVGSPLAESATVSPAGRNSLTTAVKPTPLEDIWQSLAHAAVNRWDAACVPLCLTLCLSASWGGWSAAASMAICLWSLFTLLASTLFSLAVAISVSSSTSVSLVRVAMALFGLPAAAEENCFSSKNCLRGCMQICPSSRPIICLIMQL